MDHFLVRSVALAAVALGLAVVSGRSVAANGYPYDTSGQAQAACLAKQATPGGGQTVVTSCYLLTAPGAVVGVWRLVLTGGTYDFKWQGPSGAQCRLRPGVWQFIKGGPSGGMCIDGCGYAADPGAGIQIFRNKIGGATTTSAFFKPTGATCDGSGGTATNPGELPPGDPNPPLPPLPPIPPKLCNTVACFDPGNGWCAGVGSASVCVPKPPNGQPPGGCASSGDVTLCVGNPPPMPPNPPISDPPSQITGTDGQTQQPGPGAPITNITTNIFNAGSGSTTNGAGPGDAGNGSVTTPPKGGDPAGGSSTAGPGSFGGGDNCDTPPMCTGDAVMCGVALQEWRTMCSAKTASDQAHKDLAGTEPAPSTSSLGEGLTKDKVWAPEGSLAGDPDSIGGAANRGLYNTLGFGAPKGCPLTNQTITVFQGHSISLPLQPACDILIYIRYLLIAGALYKAARITMGGNG